MTAWHRTSRRGAGVIDVLLVTASVFIVGAGIWMLTSSRRSASDITKQVPRPVLAARGGTLSSLVTFPLAGKRDTLDLRGRGRVIYYFATKCRFCQAQHEYIGGILQQLQPAEVIAVSDEPPEVLQGYWAGVAPKLPSPLSADASAIRALGIDGVPALLFVTPDGHVSSAYMGTAMAWDVGRFREELTQAASPQGRAP